MFAVADDKSRRAPRRWRWRPDVLATCLGIRAAYVSAVATEDDAVRKVRLGG